MERPAIPDNTPHPEDVPEEGSLSSAQELIISSGFLKSSHHRANAGKGKQGKSKKTSGSTRDAGKQLLHAVKNLDAMEKGAADAARELREEVNFVKQFEQNLPGSMQPISEKEDKKSLSSIVDLTVGPDARGASICLETPIRTLTYTNIPSWNFRFITRDHAHRWSFGSWALKHSLIVGVSTLLTRHWYRCVTDLAESAAHLMTRPLPLIPTMTGGTGALTGAVGYLIDMFNPGPGSVWGFDMPSLTNIVRWSTYGFSIARFVLPVAAFFGVFCSTYAYLDYNKINDPRYLRDNVYRVKATDLGRVGHTNAEDTPEYEIRSVHAEIATATRAGHLREFSLEVDNGSWFGRPRPLNLVVSEELLLEMLAVEKQRPAMEWSVWAKRLTEDLPRLSMRFNLHRGELQSVAQDTLTLVLAISKYRYYRFEIETKDRELDFQ